MHGFLWTIVSKMDQVDDDLEIRWLVKQCKQLLPQNLHGGKSGDPYALLFGECAHGAGHGSVIKFGDARLCTKAVVADMFKGDGVQGYDESFGWAAELFAAACSSGADHQKRNQAEGSANFNIYGLAGPSALTL